MKPELHMYVTVDLTVTLSEKEIRALDALAGYGTDSFLEVFYAKLGRAYLEPHESGIRSLFEKSKAFSAKAFPIAEKARAALMGLPNYFSDGGQTKLVPEPSKEPWPVPE